MNFRILSVFFFLFFCNHLNSSRDSIPNFTLFDVQDKPVQFYNILNNKKLSLVFFGYSHCPNVCYNTLHKFDLILQKLPSDTTKEVEFIFISIDPKYDNKETISKMKLKSNPSIHFFLGKENEIEIIKKSFQVKVFESNTGSDPKSSLIHSTSIFLLDKHKTLIHKIPEEIQSDDIVKFITKYLNSSI